MLKDIIPKAVGKVTSYIYDEDTLLFKKIEEIHNLVVFSGADIIAKAITGDTAYRLST